MVVSVEEGYSNEHLKIARIGGVHTQWLLLQEQKAGIDQFKEFGEVVELRAC